MTLRSPRRLSERAPDGTICRAAGLRQPIETAGIRRHRKRLQVPAAVRPDGGVQSVRNGPLEVRLSRAEPV